MEDIDCNGNQMQGYRSVSISRAALAAGVARYTVVYRDDETPIGPAVIRAVLGTVGSNPAQFQRASLNLTQ